MIQITTEKAILLVVDLPEGVDEMVVRQNSEQSDLWYVDTICHWISLPFGKWELIGKTFHLTEDQCAELVPLIDSHPDFDYYQDYTELEPRCMAKLQTAKESFLSLLEDNQIYKENPQGRKPNEMDMLDYELVSSLDDAIRQWQESQSRTMPTSVVLRKK